MKHTKIRLAYFLLGVLSSTSFAKVDLGIITSWHVTTPTGSSSEVNSPDDSARGSFGIGGSIEYALASFLKIESGVYYAPRSLGQGKQTWKQTRIELPVLLKVPLTPVISIAVGFCFSHLLSSERPDDGIKGGLGPMISLSFDLFVIEMIKLVTDFRVFQAAGLRNFQVNGGIKFML